MSNVVKHPDRKRAIYLGGPSSDLKRVLAWVQSLEARGYTLVSRWFEETKPNTVALNDREQVRRMTHNFAAMRAASIVWILWPRTGESEGALAELGYALAHRWHVGPSHMSLIVSGPGVRSNVVTAGADVRLASDREVMDVLKRHAS